MSKFVKFPSIDQFRNVCKQVIANCKYHDMDKPTITFTGTVKIHGTNAGVGYDYETGELWVQSRSRVINCINDNAGFAMFVEKYKQEFIGMFNDCFTDKTTPKIVFGEWYGGSIQKGVAVNGMDKRFSIFSAYGIEENKLNPFIDFNSTSGFIFIDKHIPVDVIEEYETFEQVIDFDFPEKSIEKLQALTEKVEKECPVAKVHGVSGTGEGIVWTGVYNNQILRFKVKGEKHSVSKVKTLAAVDVEKLESIREFVEYAVTNNRLEQGIDEVFTQNNLEPDIKMMGDYIRWVHNDVIKEEIDVLKENGLERQDYGRELADVTRRWFMAKYC